MPLGEMLDLEKLAQTCREKNRWFFFFTSAPANCPGETTRPIHDRADPNYYSWCELPCQRYRTFLDLLVVHLALRHQNENDILVTRSYCSAIKLLRSAAVVQGAERNLSFVTLISSREPTNFCQS